MNFHFGNVTDHISLEDDQFNQHSFRLPGFKSTDLKTILSSLTALWTLQMHLSILDFSILLIFDRKLENLLFSSGFWFWTKTKFEVKFFPQPFSHGVCAFTGVYLGGANGLQKSEQNLGGERLLTLKPRKYLCITLNLLTHNKHPEHTKKATLSG